MLFSIEFHARLHLYLSILFNFLFIPVLHKQTLLLFIFFVDLKHSRFQFDYASGSFDISIYKIRYGSVSFSLSPSSHSIEFMVCVLSSFCIFFFNIIVSFQWLPYLHFTFSIHTNLFTFSLRFILLLDGGHSTHINGNVMAVVRSCAYTFAIDIERLSCCQAHLHS